MKFATLAALSLGLSATAHASTLVAVTGTGDFWVFDTTGVSAPAFAGNMGVPYEFGDAGYNDLTGDLHVVIARPTPQIYTLNVFTGVSSVYPTGLSETFAADVDPTTGQVMVVDYFGSLWSVDPFSGTSTFVASTGLNADGGYWDNNLDALVINIMGTQQFYTVSRTGVVGFYADNFNWFNNNDFDLDVATNQIFSLDYSSNYNILAYPTFGILSTTTAPVYGDAVAIIDNIPGFRVTAGGTCPGNITFDIQDGTANGSYALASGSGPGAFAIPNGPCAGTVVPLANPRLRYRGTLDGFGDDFLSFNVGAGPCGAPIAVVDLTTCQVRTANVP